MEDTNNREYWRLLDESGKGDEDSKDITDALFLYALRMIQSEKPEKLKMLWIAYGQYWKDRLPIEAYEYLHSIAKSIHHTYKTEVLPYVTQER